MKAPHRGSVSTQYAGRSRQLDSSCSLGINRKQWHVHEAAVHRQKPGTTGTERRTFFCHYNARKKTPSCDLYSHRLFLESHIAAAARRRHGDREEVNTHAPTNHQNTCESEIPPKIRRTESLQGTHFSTRDVEVGRFLICATIRLERLYRGDVDCTLYPRPSLTTVTPSGSCSMYPVEQTWLCVGASRDNHTSAGVDTCRPHHGDNYHITSGTTLHTP